MQSLSRPGQEFGMMMMIIIIMIIIIFEGKRKLLKSLKLATS